VGGKGASLAKLTLACLPAPEGFNITTGDYNCFVREHGLQAVIMRALANADPDRPASLEEAARCIQEQFLVAQLPAEVAAAILEAYAALPGDNPAVAVRSSATAEDLPQASFAGQHSGGEVMTALKEDYPDCFVCRKHRGQLSVPGGAIFGDEVLYVGHVQLPEGAGSAYLAHLMKTFFRPCGLVRSPVC
jgi:hypothetical protein